MRQKQPNRNYKIHPQNLGSVLLEVIDQMYAWQKEYEYEKIILTADVEDLKAQIKQKNLVKHYSEEDI